MSTKLSSLQIEDAGFYANEAGRGGSWYRPVWSRGTGDDSAKAAETIHRHDRIPRMSLRNAFRLLAIHLRSAVTP